MGPEKMVYNLEDMTRGWYGSLVNIAEKEGVVGP